MDNTNKRLSILSELEEFAFYGFPDFDHEQQLTYFKFNDQEYELILKCSSLHTQVYCALQIGYFKAKHMFFRFSLKKAPQQDIQYILVKYFQNQALHNFTITDYEHYVQRKEISQLFGYQLWSKNFLETLTNQAQHYVKIDTAPNFIALELLDFLKNQKIVRPGYSTLQKIISRILTEERQRLKLCLQQWLTNDDKQNLDNLLKKEQTLSELASLKQDAKSFSESMIKSECRKYDVLKPLYKTAKIIMPHLDISQQNIAHYASLVHFYTLYDLKRFEKEQTYLYLLCYVIKRYQLINDNLADALSYHVQKFEEEIKENADQAQLKDTEKMDQKVGRILLMFTNEKLNQKMIWKTACQKVFKIIPKETLHILGEKLVKKSHRKQSLRWEARDKAALRYKRYLRPLLARIDFESLLPENPLLKAIHWLKDIVQKKKLLSRQPFHQFPVEFISKRLSPYLVSTDENNKKTVKANRYETLIYCQIAKQLKTGALHIEESLRHRTFFHELVSLEKKEEILKTLTIPWVKIPCKEQLDLLFKELDMLLTKFDSNLKQGKLKHLKYDPLKKEILWIKPKFPKEEDLSKETFYDKLPIVEIVDVIRFVDEKTNFLSAFTPLQPYYSKQDLEETSLMAVFIAQATNAGNHKMHQICDISYETLETTYHQRLRLETLKKAAELIIHKMAQLSIFPHYTFDLQLYAAVDGQKFEMITPTAKARNSRKYFKKGRGVVAYTLLSNYAPIQSDIIGAHDPESYYLFDVWYGNTSLINPMIITGDMHSVNKCNFAILHWFGAEFRPRFANLKHELKHIYCGKDPSHYQHFLSPPVGQIKSEVIFKEKENIDRIVASLASKEITQSTLVRKLCLLSDKNTTRQAVEEYDKLIRSIYTLTCILDPKIQSHSHRSQNRIESYHSLRAHISKVGGRKALLGKTDIEIEISNQCGRLMATVVIFYNAFLNSSLIEQDSIKNNKAKMKKVTKNSPIAFQHINFSGHFTFRKNKKKINIKKIIENIDI